MENTFPNETYQVDAQQTLKTAAQSLSEQFRALGQKEIIDEIANTQEVAFSKIIHTNYDIENFLNYSRTKYEELSNKFGKHVKVNKEMLSELEAVIKLISKIKKDLELLYPEEYNEYFVTTDE